MAGAAVFLSCAVIFAGFGASNLSGLKQLYAANCGALEAIYTEDFEKRTQPILDAWGTELKRAPQIYRVIADSPPALSGHWFEQINGEFLTGESTQGQFLTRVNIPLDRETRLTMAVRSPTNTEVTLVGVVRAKNGMLKLFTYQPAAPDSFGVLLSANRTWVVQGSEDIWAQAYRWLITNGQALDGAQLIAVGIAFNDAKFEINVDDITIWKARQCAPVKVPPIEDLCAQSYFVSVVQDFEYATSLVLSSENTQNKKLNIQHSIEESPVSAFDGHKYEYLNFKFEQEPKSDRIDLWLVPVSYQLLNETRLSISYNGPTRPTIITRVDFGGGKIGDMFSGANGIPPQIENEKRKTSGAAAQGWVTLVTPDIRAWAQDTAKKQKWNAPDPKLIAIGIDVGGLRNVDLKLDNFIVYLKSPEICKQFAK